MPDGDGSVIAFPSRDGKDRRQTFSLLRSAILVNVPEYRREREPQNKSHYLILGLDATKDVVQRWHPGGQGHCRSLTGTRFEDVPVLSSAYDAWPGRSTCWNPKRL